MWTVNPYRIIWLSHCLSFHDLSAGSRQTFAYNFPQKQRRSSLLFSSSCSSSPCCCRYKCRADCKQTPQGQLIHTNKWKLYLISTQFQVMLHSLCVWLISHKMLGCNWGAILFWFCIGYEHLFCWSNARTLSQQMFAGRSHSSHREKWHSQNFYDDSHDLNLNGWWH